MMDYDLNYNYWCLLTMLSHMMHISTVQIIKYITVMIKY